MAGRQQMEGLWALAGEFGSDWRNIGRHLGFSEPKLQNLCMDYPQGAHERCYQLLLQWNNKLDPSEMVGKLRQAFVSAERLDLIPFLTNFTGLNEELDKNVFIKKLKTFVRTKMSKLPLIPWVSTGCVYVDQVFTNVVLLISITTAFLPVRLPLKSHNAIFDSLTDEELGLINLSPTRILLLGRTGSGKTTLLTKYAYDWCMEKQDALLSKIPVVIVLPMRKLDQHSNLGQAVLDHILQSETKITAAAIEKFCEDNPDDVVILLDGYDEFKGKGLKHDNCGNIVKMLRNQCFTACRVVVTSRPGRAGDFQNEYENYRHLEITGFSSKDIDDYVYKTFKGAQRPLGDKLLLYLEENQLKTELASIPLMLTAFCQLTKWTDGKDFGELNTISKLYDRLIECVFKHHDSKTAQMIASSDGVTSHCSLDLTSEELVLELGKVSVEGFLGGAEEELIFSESDFSISNGLQVIEQGLRVGLICRDEVSCIRPQTYEDLQMKKQKLTPKRNISFVLKSFQEKFAGKYLAHLCEGVESGLHAFTAYLQRVNNDQRVLDFANILVFACAASRGAARRITAHVIGIFLEQQGENIAKYLKGKLHFKDCQKTQHLIEFCLQLNFESRSEGEFNHLFNCLFGESCRVRLVEISSYVAKALGYLFSHSCQRSTSKEGQNVLSVRSVELICIRLESSTQFREFLNCYPGSENLISSYMIGSVEAQKQNVQKAQTLRERFQSSGEEMPSYLSDRPDLTFFAVVPIWQEINKRQINDFNLGFVLSGLEKCLVQELVLNGMKSEAEDWCKLFRMMDDGVFSDITKLTLSLNGLTFDQTARLATALKSTPKLKYLKVAGNEVGEDFVEGLPPLPDVENIILDKSNLSSEAIVKFTKKLELYPCLNKIDLRRNQRMDDSAITSVCDSLDLKKNWKELRISLYNVSAYGLDYFKSKIGLASGLTHLNLVHTPIPDTVIHCSASVLVSLPSLVDLRISGIPSSSSMCTSQTVQAFTEELRKVQHLVFLSILYTEMTPSDFLTMLNSCSGHTSLKTFRFSRPCLPAGEEVERECKKAEQTFLQLWV